MTSVVTTVKNNNVGVLKLLVAVPGTVAQRELNQALLLAAGNGSAECAEVLLQAGAEPDYTNNNNNCCLKVAAEAGHHLLVRHLVAAKCAINMRGPGQATALHHAARHGHMECVVELLAGDANPNIQDSRGQTPLIMAAKNCHVTLSAMKKLIQAKCDINKQDSVGKTALHYCSHKAVGTQLLLAAGAEPDIQDLDGNCPIHLASIEGFDGVVTSLVAHKCNPDVINGHGKTALHYLAMKNHAPAIEAIAEVGGDVNKLDGNGNMPLWYAVNHNRPDAVKALLRANCIPHPTNTASVGNPLKTALEKKLFAIAKLLILAGSRLDALYDWLAAGVQEAAHQETPDGESDVEEKLERQEAMEWFDNWLHAPHSLQQLCRLAIRGCLGVHIWHQCDLPLPPDLTDYVTLKEVEDHHTLGYVM